MNQEMSNAITAAAAIPIPRPTFAPSLKPEEEDDDVVDVGEAVDENDVVEVMLLVDDVAEVVEAVIVEVDELEKDVELGEELSTV